MVRRLILALTQLSLFLLRVLSLLPRRLHFAHGWLTHIYAQQLPQRCIPHLRLP